MTDRRFPRTARLNEVLREVIADELEGMSDPRLEFVTITAVEVSPDTRHARVFYSSLGDLTTDVTQETEGATAKALESARRHLQAALGRQVRLKYVPRLAFEPDPGVESGRRIEEILRGLRDGEHETDKTDSDG